MHIAASTVGDVYAQAGENKASSLVREARSVGTVNIYTKSNFNDNDFGYMWWRRVVAGYHVIFA